MIPCKDELHVQQVNCFYNYTVGLDVTEVDLLKTAVRLIKSGMVRAVSFSDRQVIYLDGVGDPKFEWLKPDGRQWDNNWSMKFDRSVPENVASELVFSLGLDFHEQIIVGRESRQIPSYIRAGLPPIILELDDLTLPIHPSLKLYADGVMLLAFQLDTSWGDLSEVEFIDKMVNLFQRYAKRIWMAARVQYLDCMHILPTEISGAVSVGGQTFLTRATRKSAKAKRADVKAMLEAHMLSPGCVFNIGGESWNLHQVFGSEGKDDWESTLSLCQSIYASALAGQIVSSKHKAREAGIALWEGRPSISLVRFLGQPDRKADLFEQFGPSLSRVMNRSPWMDEPPPLPTDLRWFEDYCFHGNRALLLWTWLRPRGASQDAWEDVNTRSLVLSNQARAELFDYHNMRIARAAAMASAPQSDEQLIYAYQTLASAESVIRNSSQTGEVSSALEYLLSEAGTTQLISSGKEQARWHLDERRLHNENRRARMDRWLSTVFGLVGAAGLGDLVVKPLVRSMFPVWPDWWVGLAAFLLASLLIGLLAVCMWIVNYIRK